MVINDGITWQYYPKSDYPQKILLDVIEVFKKNEKPIDSGKKQLVSNELLSKIRNDLKKIGFVVEEGKKKEEKIKIPVLFGENGTLEKSFETDAYHQKSGTVIEVEAGKAVTNYQFLRDLFQACMMKDTYYLIIAVRNVYHKNPDFQKVNTFFSTLYASQRLTLPLKGILIIGY
ncbi:MAG: hypothetical protein U9O53_03605 [archaeon]|nr:hypothetical protein [archaeon]